MRRKAAAALERLVRQGGVADPVAEAEQDGASHQDVAPDSATDVPVVSPSADGSTRALGGGREATGDRRNVATVVALMLVGTVAVVWARFDDAAPAKTPSAAASQVLRPPELTAPETPQPLPRVVPSNSAETEPPSSAESTRPPPVVVPKPAVPMANWRAAAMAVALPLARRAGRVCGRDYRAAGAAYSVAPDGSIHNLVIMPPGSLLPNAARACIEQVMRAVTFPAPGVNESLTVVINPIP